MIADACFMALCAAYVLVLGTIALSDVRRRIIPNAAVLALALLGSAVVLLAPSVSMAGSLPTLSGSLPFALALLAVSVMLEYGWRFLHGGAHGMGMGDIKLCAAAAVALGPWVVPCLALACLLAGGVNFLRHTDRFAFAPWLCPVFAVCFLYRAFCA